MNTRTPLSSSMRRFLYVIGKSEAASEIEKFRNNWEIDSGGFNCQAKQDAWAEKKFARPEYTKGRIIIRSKTTLYRITKERITKKEFPEQSVITKPNATKQERFNDNFRKAVNELGAKIGMDNNWEKLFSLYLLRGNKVLNFEQEQEVEIIKTTEFYKNGEPIRVKFQIIVEPNTKKEDAIFAWVNILEKDKNTSVGYIEVPNNLSNEKLLRKIDVNRQSRK